MAFMQQTVLALACLAIVASAPLVAAQCKTTRQTQLATVNKQTPKGCVARSIESGAFPLPDASCLYDLVLNVTNTTGVDCDEAAISVSVSFKNATACFGDEVGTANLTALKAGGYNIKGSFLGGTNFTGKQSADAKSMTVSVEGQNCELTYTLKAVKEEEAKEPTNSTAAPAAPETPAGPAPAGPAPADGGKKSSAAGLSGVAAVVAAVLGAAAAALAL